MRRYSVVLQPEPEGAFTVTVPILPGCITVGDTVEEALENAKDAIRLFLESLAAHGEEIPEEIAPAQLATVDVQEADVAPNPMH
jgi:predicted RNase H-like HicB family nuclease